MAEKAAADPQTRMQRYCDALDELVAIGMDLARLAQQQAHSPAEPAASPVQQATIAYERVTRSIRRNMLLARKLSQPEKPSRLQAAQRVAARKRIIRAVEDAIHNNVHNEHAEALHGELLDRLDSPDLEDEIANHPVGDIATDICRDLGLARLDGTNPWKRRAPHDIAILNARAERLPGAPPSEKLAALLAAAPPPPPTPTILRPTGTGRVVATAGTDLSKLSDEDLDCLMDQLGILRES